MPTKQYIKKLNGYFVKDEDARNGLNEVNARADEIENDAAVVQYIFPNNWGLSHSGDANLIKAFGKSVLIDTHRASNKANLEAMLTDNGVSHIDYLIVTHYHDDHMGNVANLITDGFVDQDTEVFLSSDCDFIDNEEYLQAYKAEVINALNAAEISYHTPTEGEQIIFSSSCKLTFYNTDRTAIDQYVDYNNASIICKFEHGATTTIYTGDALGYALNRALNNGFFDRKIDLYKIEHHGIQRNNSIVDVLKTLQPDYAVQPSAQGDAQRNIFSQSTTMGYLQSKGCRIFSCHKNSGYIIFESTKNSMELVQGLQNPSMSNYNSGTFDVMWVDSSTTSDIQDGTVEHPFKELSQAIGECERMGSGHYKVNLRPGTYADGTENDINDVAFNGLDVEIASSTNTSSDVTICAGFTIQNSKVRFANVTLDTTALGSSTNTTITAVRSDVEITNCVLDGDALTNGTAVWSNHSKITVDSSTISNYKIGISAHYDSVYSFAAAFSGITNNAFQLSRSDLRDKNTTYTNVGAKVSGDGGSYRNGVIREEIYFGDLKTGSASLKHDVRKYNKLLVQSGYKSGGTMYTDTIYAWRGENIGQNDALPFKTNSESSTLTFSNNGTTVTLGSTLTEGVRVIYGIVEDTDSEITNV